MSDDKKNFDEEKHRAILRFKAWREELNDFFDMKQMKMEKASEMDDVIINIDSAVGYLKNALKSGKQMAVRLGWNRGVDIRSFQRKPNQPKATTTKSKVAEVINGND